MPPAVNTMEAIRERLTRLEGMLGVPQMDADDPLWTRVENTLASLALLQEDHATMLQRMEELMSDVRLLKIAFHSPSRGDGVVKMKVPDPKPFNGLRSAKDLENFLWDMEQYFNAAHALEAEKVSITSMYLVGDAKLWWRTRMEDIARPKIETWEVLKHELKEQFLPCNTAWVARDSLRRLRQTGSVREYVKDFCSLMLDIKDMSEADRLFNFLSGLQPWAQLELRRQGVKELSAAVAAADGLIDLRISPSGFGSSSNKTQLMEKNHTRRNKPNDAGDRSANSVDKGKAKVEGVHPTRDKGNPHPGCYICNGPHFAKNCPNQSKINAILVEDGKNEDSDSDGPQRMAPLQLLGAIRVVKAKSRPKLMFVTMEINGCQISALVDTGATHSFVAEKMSDKLGLSVVEHSDQIKAVNSQPRAMRGMACGVQVTVGEWAGKMNLMVVPLDDFNVILGNDFFVVAKVAILPHLFGLLIGAEEKPCFVAGCSNCIDTAGVEGVLGTVAAISNVEADYTDNSWVAAPTDCGWQKLLREDRDGEAQMSSTINGLLRRGCSESYISVGRDSRRCLMKDDIRTNDKAGLLDQQGKGNVMTDLVSRERRPDWEVKLKQESALWQIGEGQMHLLHHPPRTSGSLGGGGLSQTH